MNRANPAPCLLPGLAGAARGSEVCPRMLLLPGEG